VSQYVGSIEGGNGVVVMTNTFNTALYDEIVNSVASVYKWKNFYTPVIQKEIILSDNDLNKYLGKYLFGADTVLLEKTNNRIHIKAGETVQWQIHFTDNTHFFVTETNADFNFITDSSGKVTGFTMNDLTISKIE